MAFEVGQTVGPYELLELVRISGPNLTYKVCNTLAKRTEVLKVLPKEYRADTEGLERFKREVRVHAQLSHPNIADFYNAMELEGELVMTSEWLEGTSLEDMLETERLPIALVVSHAVQVLSALEYAHEKGVIHRNLSPRNIIIAGDGSVKLAGFELAKTSRDAQLTAEGSVVGSVNYICPEQAKGTLTLDTRSDIYSLGAVLYESVTGAHVFDFPSKFEVMQAHVQKQPAPPRELRRDLPEELNRAILKALAKEPSQRFQSAAEFRKTLEQYETRRSGHGTRTEDSAKRRRTGLSLAAHRRSERKRLAKVALMTCLIAIGAFVVVILLVDVLS